MRRLRQSCLPQRAGQLPRQLLPQKVLQVLDLPEAALRLQLEATRRQAALLGTLQHREGQHESSPTPRRQLAGCCLLGAQLLLADHRQKNVQQIRRGQGRAHQPRGVPPSLGEPRLLPLPRGDGVGHEDRGQGRVRHDRAERVLGLLQERAPLRSPQAERGRHREVPERVRVVQLLRRQPQRCSGARRVQGVHQLAQRLVPV